MNASPDEPAGRPQPWRQHLSFPGLLMPAIAYRIPEVQAVKFSRYATELVCFDLRIRRAHAVTSFIAHEPLAVQGAVDRALVAGYEPDLEHNGGLLRALVHHGRDAVPHAGAPMHSLANQREWVFFPGRLQEIIEIRQRELGFVNLSQYVTSVIRYDLLISGRHKLFCGDELSPEELNALDWETIREFYENRQPRTMADRLVEEVAGRRLTREECDAALRVAGQHLRDGAIERFLC
jgi:hypothetical protein